MLLYIFKSIFRKIYQPKNVLFYKNSKEKQTIVLQNQGISIINLDNIFDISKKSNIVVYINLDI